MKIIVEFDSLAEFMQHMRTGEGFEPEPEAAPAKKSRTPKKQNAFQEAQEKVEELRKEVEAEEPAMNQPEPVDTGTGAIVGATPEEMKQIEAEEKPAPTYVLADAQKAVREVVKKKGKDVAKEILGHYKHKDKEDGPATGASALKPEDYAAAIRELEEALNG